VTSRSRAQIPNLSARRHIPPPEGMDPMIANFIAELAREMVYRQNNPGKATGDQPRSTDGGE
jgi:hypothetical protein